MCINTPCDLSQHNKNIYIMYYKTHESQCLYILMSWNGFLIILGIYEYVAESVAVKDGLFTLKYNSL